MSNRRLIVAITLFVLASACARASLQDRIVVADGSPFAFNEGTLNIKFDGSSFIIVSTNSKTLSIPARTPATVLMSPDRQFMVLNFGDGSGQVLDLEAYDLRSLRQISVLAFKANVVSATKAGRCDIRDDEISYVASDWRKENELRVKTENWSRRAPCAALDRGWILSL